MAERVQSALEPVRLDYAAVPTRWQRWRGRVVASGMVVGSHGIAAVCTFGFLMATGGLFGVISGIMTIFTTPPGGDGPGAPEAMVGAIILGIFFAFVGALLAVMTIMAGIIVDALRRPLRVPWWVALLLVGGMLNAGCMIEALVVRGFSPRSLLIGGLWGLAFGALFCVYWIPMGCAEGILRLMKWGIGRGVEWYRGRRKEGESMTGPGGRSVLRAR